MLNHDSAIRNITSYCYPLVNGNVFHPLYEYLPHGLEKIRNRIRRSLPEAILEKSLCLVGPQLGVTGVHFVFEHSPSHAIESTGVGGYTHSPYLIVISLDGTRRRLGQLMRIWLPPTIAHESYHAVRLRQKSSEDGTLLAALLSEGLASEFEKSMFPTLKIPWLCAITDLEIPQLLKRATPILFTKTYSVTEWFFGTGNLPRWAGYTLGHYIVRTYIQKHPGETAISLIGLTASEILSGSGLLPIIEKAA